MKIPAVRDALENLARELRAKKGLNWKTVAADIEELVPELKRRSPQRRVTGVTRNPLSPAKKREIAQYAKMHEDVPMQEIGIKFGVNQGRISEIIAGFRE